MEMGDEEPKIRIEDREELIFMLAEAAAIEHNVMCCYLYGIWSLKRGERDGLTKQQAEIVKGWKTHMTIVAIEEMTHLTLVGNLACAIGASPHLSRPNFPIPFGYHPSAIVLELFGFSHALLDHAIFLERPEGVQMSDAPEFVHPSDYHLTAPKDFIMPSSQDYETIGHLYRGIYHGMKVLAGKLGEETLFCGDVADQIGPADAPLPGFCTVTDLASAHQAIEMIVEQGEGAPEHSENSHYQKFLNVRAQLEEMLAQDPGFEPAFPVARNPVMREPLDPENQVWINDPEAAKVLDIANSMYNLMLRFLVQGFGRDPDESDHKQLFVVLARELMAAMTPICEHLASLPAGPDHPGVNAGMTFTMIRDVARLPSGRGEMQILCERLREIATKANRIFPDGHELDGVGGVLRAMAEKIVIPGAPPVAPKLEQEDKPKSKTTEEDAILELNHREGKILKIDFDVSRCIRARYCVLGATEVFVGGVEGEWLFPDRAEVGDIRGIIHECPSGALTYEPKGDTPPEPVPDVNLLNMRENGPNAIRAEIELDGEEIGYRVALCRCGASKNKPFCDMSHARIGFKATGEPDSQHSEPLAIRNGVLKITPQKNGPNVVTGNLEICSSTARTIDRVTSVRLCRCGGSKNKPFCDNTHLKIGFKSD